MRILLLSLLAFVAGCQCVTVPERQYACEPGDQICLSRDSGTPDSGTPDSGISDSGTPDAAIPCDGGLCRFDDGGFCTDWQCVQSLWVPSSTSFGSTGVRVTELPSNIDGGQYGWFGGVLLPDGRVLAIMHTAEQFLIFDPRAETVVPVGPLHPGAARKFAGGVLAPNGRVYVFPYEETSLLEFNPEDAGFAVVGPAITAPDGGAPHYVGGVVDAYGTVWSVSEHSDGLPMLRYDPATKELTFHQDKTFSQWGGWWGLTRLPDDRLLVFPKEYFGNPSVLSPRIVAVEPTQDDAGFVEVAGFDMNDAGFGLQGASLTREGHACSTPAGLDERVVCVSIGVLGVLQADVFTGPLNGYGFNGTFGDGRVWTTPDSNNLLARIAGDGGITTTTVQGGRYGYLGLVATPQGIVAIPGAPGSGFLLIQPGMQLTPGIYDARPMPVLLSPYFNKL